MLSRLLEAHQIIVEKVRDAIIRTAVSRDEGTNDLLVSDVLRRNELQVWFVAEHRGTSRSSGSDRSESLRTLRVSGRV